MVTLMLNVVRNCGLTDLGRTTHKFGIEVPKSVNEAYAIARLTGTTFWTDAINKEMKNVRIAFEKLEEVTGEDMRTGKVKLG